MKKRYNIKIISRKGKEFVYIKPNQKGTKGKYFTYKDDILDPYAKYYQDKYEKGKKEANLKRYREGFENAINKKRVPRKDKTWQYTNQARRYLRKLKKRGNVEDNLQIGEGAGKIEDALTCDEYNIHDAYKQMLSNLVKDKELLNIIATEHILAKMKHRLEIRLRWVTETGEEIAQAKKFNISLLEAVLDIRKCNYKREMLKDYWYDKFSKLGYIINNTNKQPMQLHNVQLTIIFRKGQRRL